MLLTGVALAACAALTHTAIDSTRKYAGSIIGLPSDGLVMVPALLDMLISCSGVWWSGRYKGPVRHPTLFVTATIISSLLLLISRYMYQRAIQLSPLSLTIPYLAFTPAILIATAYVFLGELPSPSGLLGVLVVAMGGYLLNLKAGAGSGAKGGTGTGSGTDSSGAVPTANGFAAIAGVNVGKATDGPAGVCLQVAATALPAASTALTAGPVGSAMGSLMQRSASTATVADLESGPGPGSGPAGAGSGGSGKRGVGKSFLHRRMGSTADMARTVSVSMLGTGWQQEPGTLLMIGVAVIWSVTASLDKLGVLTGPTIWAYFAAQRLVIGLASLSYILVVSPRLLLLLRDHFWVMLVVSALELAGVLFFLLAVRHLLVSYVVAIKRCNVLFSVVLGALLFRENVGGRLPYVFLMMLGMTAIVLEPGVHSLVHSHNK